MMVAELPPVIPAQSRLKGTLLGAHQESRQTLASGLDSLREIGLRVELDPSTQLDTLGPAEIYRCASLSGIVHISPNTIEAFREEGVGPNGKFGRGTYFAAGQLEGETFSALRTPGNVLQAADVNGSVMIVDRENIKELDDLLKDRVGLPESRLKTTVKNAPVADTLAHTELGIDVLVVFMDKDRTSAEVVVLSHAVDRVAITDTKVL